MRAIRTLLALILLLAFVAAGIVYSGVYDVAAAQPEPPWLQSALTTVKDRSIERHAAAIAVPQPLPGDPATLRTGLTHFHGMCVTCHGAPGVKAAEFAQGLNPKPPDLAREAADQSPAQLFWVTKNGIKMTGMPAFGSTHTDPQLWALVAFLKQLPQLTPEKYQALLRDAGLTGAPAGPSPNNTALAPSAPSSPPGALGQAPPAAPPARPL